MRAYSKNRSKKEPTKAPSMTHNITSLINIINNKCNISAALPLTSVTMVSLLCPLTNSGSSPNSNASSTRETTSDESYDRDLSFSLNVVSI